MNPLKYSCMFALWSIGLFNLPVLAQETQDRFFAIYFDNDVLLDVNGEEFGEDRNYTMGLGFVWQPEKPREYWMFDVHDELNQWLNIGEHNGKSHRRDDAGFIRYKLSGTAFTPENLSSAEVVVEDRPYSFLLNHGIEQVSVWSDDDGQPDYAEKTEFSIGIYGLPIGEWVQKAIHEALDGVEPRGWDNQISDGGEPSLFLRRSQQWLAHSGNVKGRVNYDLTTNFEVGIGYQTYVQTGFDLRFGHTDISSFYEHDFISLGPQTKTLTSRPRQREAGAYFYLGYRASVPIYNVGLQGQFRSNPHQISAKDIKRLVHTYGFGVVAKAKENWGVVFAMTWRTPEFKSDLIKRTHGYGSLNLFFHF